MADGVLGKEVRNATRKINEKALSLVKRGGECIRSVCVIDHVNIRAMQGK